MEKLANRSWPPVGDLTWLGTHLQAVPNGQKWLAEWAIREGKKCNFNEMDHSSSSKQSRPRPGSRGARDDEWRMNRQNVHRVLPRTTKNSSPSLLLSPFKLNSSFSFHFLVLVYPLFRAQLTTPPLHHFFFTPAYFLDWTTEWTGRKQKYWKPFFLLLLSYFLCR